MRKFKTILTCIVLVIFNSTDIYSQNTDNTFGIFESLVGYKLKSDPSKPATNKGIEFNLIDNGQTLTIIFDRGRKIYLKKTAVPNQFTVEGRNDYFKKIKRSTATITSEGILEVEEKYWYSIFTDTGAKYNYKLTNRGILQNISAFYQDRYWYAPEKTYATYYLFPDQMDPDKLTNEAGLLVEYDEIYSNERHALNEFYRVIGLKGTDLKINLKTSGKTKVTFYDSNGNIIDSVDSNSNATLNFPITKDDIYFISLLRDDESKSISLQFFLE